MTELAKQYCTKVNTEVDLSSFLEADDRSISGTADSALSTMSRTALRNLDAALAEIKRARPQADLRKCPVVVDLANSRSFGCIYTWNCLPTITKSHAAANAYWLVHRSRTLSTRELLRAQGFDPDRVVLPTTEKVSPRTVPEMVGNAFTVTVIERLLAVLLPAIGFQMPASS